MSIKVTVWNEYRHEKSKPKVAEIYPKGIHAAIADFLGKDPEVEVRTATLDDPDHGLTDEVLNNTDVLVWWGHMAHNEVKDEIVEKIYKRVMSGMGFIALHSAHFSKVFIKLMGTSCTLRWREIKESERLWVIEPNHPIVEGIGPYIELEHEEMYGERFDIPEPDELLFIGWFKGGDVFRSGCCYKRGYGKVFYFQPGHESFPTFYNESIQRVITNAVKWARPIKWRGKIEAPKCEALEKI